MIFVDRGRGFILSLCEIGKGLGIRCLFIGFISLFLCLSLCVVFFSFMPSQVIIEFRFP